MGSTFRSTRLLGSSMPLLEMSLARGNAAITGVCFNMMFEMLDLLMKLNLGVADPAEEIEHMC